MILLWMLHACALGLLAGLAAWLAERALRLVGRPARAVWAIAMALSVALPVRALRAPAGPPLAAAASAGGGTLDGDFLRAAARSAAGGARGEWTGERTLSAPVAWRRLDRPLLALWLAVSLLLALRVSAGAWRLDRRVRRWPVQLFGTARVRVAPDLGPAVFGALRPEVLVPRWALDDPRLPLMLAHESAHLRGRDPLLLAVAGLAAVLLPWNPALWWQLRRLRLSVEVDCDARVLAEHRRAPGAVRAYGALLLDVASRTPAAPGLAALAPTLLATPSTLSRRIHAMTSIRPRHAHWRAAALATAAPLLIVAACELPRPTAPRARAQVPLARVNAVVRNTAAPPAPVGVEQLRAAMERAFPGALAERRGATQRLWFVQDASGRVSRVMRGLAIDASPMSLRDATIAIDRGGAYVRGQVDPSSASAFAVAGVKAEQIATVDVMKLAPGRLAPDSTEAIWIRLRGADAPGEAAAVFFRTPAPTAAAAASDAAPAAARGSRVTIARRPAPAGADTTPTAGVRLRVGANGARPLYVIDGVVVSADSATLPTPDRIERVEVLKGAAAVQAYGARAEGGVVTITLKKP